MILKNKLLNFTKFPLIAFLLISTSYVLIKLGFQCHWDEWTGRGLFPALSMANGEDIYSLNKQPLVTGYGAGMALFYLIASIGRDPIQSITIAYLMNVTSMLFILILCIIKLEYRHKSFSSERLILYVTLFCFFILTSSSDLTLNYIFTIHADWPALFYLFTSLILYRFRLSVNKFKVNFLISILIGLAFWTKITVLPSLFVFILIPFLAQRYKDAFFNLTIIGVSVLFFYTLLGSLYGFKDVFFFTFQSAQKFSWIDRDTNIFIGNGVNFETFGKKITLLLKMFTLYITDYWYYLFAAVITLSYYFVKKSFSNMLFPMTFLLLLPSCLSALAKWGGIENSLLFCNSLGLFLFIEIIFNFCEKEINENKNIYLFPALLTLLCVVSITPIRVAKTINSHIVESPNTQAFNYLAGGNHDVFFPWYPIAHYFAEGKIYSGLEVPTWIGLAFPELINFDKSHFPNDVAVIALSDRFPYGKSAIERNIGKLIKIDHRKELYNWGLYKIDE